MPFWKAPEEWKKKHKARIRLEMVPRYFKNNEKINLRLHSYTEVIGKKKVLKCWYR